MKCINCGAENANGAKFCFNCGSSIVNDPQPQVSVDQTQDIPEIQPQYVPEQTQYEANQTQYAPDNTQYGYEQYGQPQYGYEQPQYVYAQPQYSYEQPAAPAKKSKKSTGVIVVLVVLLLAVLGFGGYIVYDYIDDGEGLFDGILNKETTAENEEEKGPEFIHVNKNKMYERGSVELWLVESKTYQGALNPASADEYYVTPLEDDPNSYYFGICFRVKNVSDEEIDFNNLYMAGSLDDKYDLSDRWELYYESADGSVFDNDSTIDPDEIKTVYFVCKVNNTYVETYKKLTLSFGFKSDFSKKPSNDDKGKESCDYIFEFVGVK